MMERIHESGIVCTDDPTRLDFDVIHGYLAQSYWSAHIPRQLVERAAQGSIAIGLYDGEAQIGYARVISDGTTFAYLADVFVLDAYQGRGLGTWFMQQILDHPNLQDLRRWLLTTQDAHAFYERLGFVHNPFPERFMVIAKENPYAPAEA
ncbi:MAG: GNAT family N-acetyltransferase [Bacteroidota bacterium]